MTLNQSSLYKAWPFSSVGVLDLNVRPMMSFICRNIRQGADSEASLF